MCLNEQDMHIHQQQQEHNWESRDKRKDSWEWGRNTVREMGWGMIHSQETRTKERGHSEGEEEVAEEDAVEWLANAQASTLPAMCTRGSGRRKRQTCIAAQ